MTALEEIKKDSGQINPNTPERLWIGAADDDGEHEVWFDPDEGGTAYIRADVVASNLESLQRENEELRHVNKRLLGEATVHSMEARGANATINEIYQIISGGKGEPGNWNGAEPVRQYAVATGVEMKRLREALQNVMGCYDTPLSRRRFPPDDFMTESLEEARQALARTGGEHAE